MEDEVFLFRALCFGLSTAPQSFTRVMARVSSIMHRYGFRIFHYLDDWLVLGSSFQENVRARDFLLWLCQELGIHVNLPKNSLTPAQSIDYLRMRIQTSSLRVFPTLKQVQKLSSLVQDFLSCWHHPLSVWRQLLGVMSSVSSLVPRARLCMWFLQLRLNVVGSRLVDYNLVSWDDFCLSDLRWWSNDSHLPAGLPLDTPQPGLFLFTDASNTGWGASLGDDHLSGSWSQICTTFSINHWELLAVLFTVRGFLSLLVGRSEALYADSTTSLAYLKKQGGTHSQTLNAVAQVILRLCKSHRIHLFPQFIPQCPGGLYESEVSSLWIGVDSLPPGVPGTSTPLASHYQPFCHGTQPSPVGLLLSYGGSSVSGDG